MTRQNGEWAFRVGWTGVMDQWISRAPPLPSSCRPSPILIKHKLDRSLQARSRPPARQANTR